MVEIMGYYLSIKDENRTEQLKQYGTEVDIDKVKLLHLDFVKKDKISQTDEALLCHFSGFNDAVLVVSDNEELSRILKDVQQGLAGMSNLLTPQFYLAAWPFIEQFATHEFDDALPVWTVRQ